MKYPKQYVVFTDTTGKELFRMTAEGSSEGEIEETIGLLAYERGLDPESIRYTYSPMMYSIFMLKDNLTTVPKRFMRYDWTMAHGGVNVNEYDTVYTGYIEPRATVEETLEAIFTMFNVNHPADYRGRSLSVSDLVALEEIGTYFCDSVGFKQIY